MNTSHNTLIDFVFTQGGRILMIKVDRIGIILRGGELKASLVHFNNATKMITGK